MGMVSDMVGRKVGERRITSGKTRASRFHESQDNT
jgi:hypothetical protein